MIDAENKQQPVVFYCKWNTSIKIDLSSIGTAGGVFLKVELCAFWNGFLCKDSVPGKLRQQFFETRKWLTLEQCLMICYNDVTVKTLKYREEHTISIEITE